MTLEVHNPAAFENAFRCRTVALTGTPLFADYIKKHLADEKLSVISPDAGGMKRAELLRETLESALGQPVGKGLAEKHRSGGVVSGDLFVGEVAGTTALIVDDLISTGGTLLRAARSARTAGAKRVLALVTHGLFMPGAAEVLADPALDQIVVTDAVPPFRLDHPEKNKKLVVLPAAPLHRRGDQAPARSSAASPTSSCSEPAFEFSGAASRRARDTRRRGAAISPACADALHRDARSPAARAAWRGSNGRTRTAPRPARRAASSSCAGADMSPTQAAPSRSHSRPR